MIKPYIFFTGNIFKQYKDLEGDIFTAEVHHIRSREVILLDDDGNELILPKDKQIPSDYYRKGDSVRKMEWKRDSL